MLRIVCRSLNFNTKSKNWSISTVIFVIKYIVYKMLSRIIVLYLIGGKWGNWVNCDLPDRGYRFFSFLTKIFETPKLGIEISKTTGDHDRDVYVGRYRVDKLSFFVRIRCSEDFTYAHESTGNGRMFDFFLFLPPVHVHKT